MAANVETMMYVREAPWHGLGVKVEEAPTSADALRLAGLDWNVLSTPIYQENQQIIPGYKANMRETDKSVLGVVSDKYQIVQNSEAFAFTDELIDGDVRYETAGSLGGGKRIWVLAKMPTEKIAGDDVEPFLCFSNSHDGSTKIRACMTPIRVVCQNTMNLAFSQAKRQWSTRHTKNVKDKILEAQHCLELAGKYMEGLGKFADQLVNTRVTDEKIAEILEDLFPYDDEKDTERKKTNMKKCRDEFMICYNMLDIAKFYGTAWGVVNAASDMATHSQPVRNTKNYKENNWARVMDGHALIDSVVSAVSAI